MSFQKKQRIHPDDGRPKGTKLERREARVASLRLQNDQAARQQLKKMNVVVYRGSRSNLRDWYVPTGVKINAKP